MKRINKILSAVIMAMPFMSSCKGDEPVDVYGPAPVIDDGTTDEPIDVYGPPPCVDNNCSDVVDTDSDWVDASSEA